MKRAFCIFLTIIIMTTSSIPVFADEVKYEPQSAEGQNLYQFLNNRTQGLLVLRNNYCYMTFVADFMSDRLSLYLLEMTDKLINTGSKPDKKKYMETLVNVIAASDLDRADNVANQKKMDNLKSLKDYAMDFSEMGKDAVSVMVGSSSTVSTLENELKIAVNGVYTLADNTDNWIEAISNLETITQDYSEHDDFLALIENESDGELREAASTLRSGMRAAFKIKLDTYADVSNENFMNYEEFFFSDVFFETVKNMPEYENDEALKFFTDAGDNVVSIIGTLNSAWNLGKSIGTLVGDVVVGGENLINRVLEMMAIYDISLILQDKLLNAHLEFIKNVGKDKEKELAEEYISFSNYLIGCRLRGEYCLYSTVAKDAGLLSWFDKKSAEEAESWYNNKTEKILNIQKDLLRYEDSDTWKVIYDNTSEQTENSDLDQYLNNMEIPVNIYTFFTHYWDLKAIDINDPYTFWMMLSFYATMEMDDDLMESGGKLAEKYNDIDQGAMLILSEEEVRDAVNAMMPSITEYPDFPDMKYEKPYKKDGNYYFSLLDLDTEATRMTDIKINDDGTATAIAEAFSYSSNTVYATYQIELVKNEKINFNSPEPYPYCIESIKAFDTAKYVSQKSSETYRDVIDDLEKEYGSLTLKIHEERYLQSYDSFENVAEANGLCYLSLIDFNNDGIKELLAVAKHENDPEFTVMVFTEEKGQAVKLFSSTKLTDASWPGDYLCLLSDNNHTYIDRKQWGGEWDYNEIYGYENGEFELISISCMVFNFEKGDWDYCIVEEIPDVVDRTKLKRKLVSQDEYIATHAYDTESTLICLGIPDTDIESGNYYGFDFDTLQDSIDKVKKELAGSDQGTTDSNENDYQEIINEYRSAIDDYELYEKDSIAFMEKYPLVNCDALIEMWLNTTNPTLFSAHRDINKDGVEELILSTGIDNNYAKSILTRSGDQVIPLINDVGERSYISVYDDGTILRHDSGGALYSLETIYEINENGDALNTIRQFEVDWEEDPDYPYFDGTGRISYEQFSEEYLSKKEMEFQWTMEIG